MTVHSFARSKLPRQNMMNNVKLFFRVLVLGNSSASTRDNRYNCALPTQGHLRMAKTTIVCRRTCSIKSGNDKDDADTIQTIQVTKITLEFGTEQNTCFICLVSVTLTSRQDKYVIL